MNQDQQIRELTDWWLSTASHEIEPMAAKAVEYGAGDLVEIGRKLRAAGVINGADSYEYQRKFDAELGIWFYLVGKMARWASAIEEGRKVSDDTLRDIGVYVRMAQRVRAVGSWPGTGGEMEEVQLDSDPRWYDVSGVSGSTPAPANTTPIKNDPSLQLHPNRGGQI